MNPNLYTIKTSQVIDKVRALKMFEQLFKKMGVNDEKVLLEAKNALSSFQVSDASSFMISTKTRMPIKGIHKRTGGAANIHQEKNYEPLVK